MRTVKIGIVGCGGIANGKHMPSLCQIDNVEMVAFCDIIEERAQKAAEQYGTPDAKVFKDYRQLIALPDIEVVHVLTPNKMHAPITVAALKAGKHVMCEKPMAKTHKEAQAMLEAARESGKKLTIGYNGRFSKENLYLKQLCDEGALGEIYYARSASTRRRGVPTWGVFTDKEAQGGGPLIDIATHSLDQTLWFMNNYEPDRVLGATFTKLNYVPNGNDWGYHDPEKFDVEDSAFAMVRMKNGAMILIESSWSLNMIVPNGHVLCGTRGGADTFEGLRINGDKDGSLFVTKHELNPYTMNDYYHGKEMNTFLCEAKHWIDCIVNDKQPLTRPEQACVVSQILEGVYLSAKSGKEYVFK